MHLFQVPITIMASIRDCLSEAVRKVNFDVVEKLLESYNPFYTSTNANQTKRFKLSNSDAEKYIYNLLCDAINAKSLKMFDFLLSNGFVLIDDTSKRVPLLHKAVESGSEDIVKLLLLRGANVRSKDNNGRTPLHLAATKGHLEIAKFLLLNGANVNAKTYSGQSALHEAIKMNHKELAEILISNKADVNAKSRFCEHESRWSTPLYKALEIGSVDLVKLLLSNGASPQFIRYNSRAFLDDADSNFHKGCVNALTLAVAKGNEEVVKLLIQLGMNVNSSDYRGSAMHLALENKHEEIFLYLLNNGGDVTVQCNADLLQLAASRGLLKSVEKLLELGVDCNSWDCNGKTPLMFAAGSGHVEIVKLLLENGACVLKHDKDRNTAFSHAALISHREIVELMAKEFEEMIEESEDEDWCEQIKSILQHAIQKGHDTVVEVFTEHGYLEILEEESDDEESEEEDSMVLHCAAEGGHLEMMKMLLSEGSDVNAEDSAGGTPLHSATCTGEKEAVILLLKNGADIDAIDMFSTTPLLNAIDFGHADVVQILMEYGADIDISDNNDRKALQVAYEESDEIVETMIKVIFSCCLS